MWFCDGGSAMDCPQIIPVQWDACKTVQNPFDTMLVNLREGFVGSQNLIWWCLKEIFQRLFWCGSCLKNSLPTLLHMDKRVSRSSSSLPIMREINSFGANQECYSGGTTFARCKVSSFWGEWQGILSYPEMSGLRDLEMRQSTKLNRIKMRFWLGICPSTNSYGLSLLTNKQESLYL